MRAKTCPFGAEYPEDHGSVALESLESFSFALAIQRFDARVVPKTRKLVDSARFVPENVEQAGKG